MENVLKRFEETFKKTGVLDISDDEEFYANKIGMLYEFNEECSVVINSLTIFEDEYFKNVIKVNPSLIKADNIDDAWEKIKDSVKNDLEFWIFDCSNEDDFHNDEDFMALIDRIVNK